MDSGEWIEENRGTSERTTRLCGDTNVLRARVFQPATTGRVAGGRGRFAGGARITLGLASPCGRRGVPRSAAGGIAGIATQCYSHNDDADSHEGGHGTDDPLGPNRFVTKEVQEKSTTQQDQDCSQQNQKEFSPQHKSPTHMNFRCVRVSRGRPAEACDPFTAVTSQVGRVHITDRKSMSVMRVTSRCEGWRRRTAGGSFAPPYIYKRLR